MSKLVSLALADEARAQALDHLAAGRRIADQARADLEQEEPELRCPVELRLPPLIPCELVRGHAGAHRSGLLLWHEPPLVLIDGEPVDLTDSERWRDGDVSFSWEETR